MAHSLYIRYTTEAIVNFELSVMQLKIFVLGWILISYSMALSSMPFSRQGMATLFNGQWQNNCQWGCGFILHAPQGSNKRSSWRVLWALLTLTLGFFKTANYLKVCLVAWLLNKMVFWDNEALLWLYRLGWFCSSPWAILLSEMRVSRQKNS